MAEKVKTPAIRFKGFAEAWEQRKLGELYAKSSEKNDGSIGMDKYITVATMQFKKNATVSTEEYLKTYYKFNLGDIAFEGNRNKEFRFGRFVENDIGDGVVSHVFVVFRPIVAYDLKFWKYAINNENLMQRVLSRSTKASTMMHDLVSNDFLKQDFLVPSIEEQKQIGKYFKQLDNLITLHQRKLEKLKNIKKSCLEKMFPKNGENAPEIRFKGFTEAWEQRKLGEVVDVCGGRDYKHLLEGDIPVYGTGGYMLSVNEALSYEKDGIGIGRKGTIDKPYILKAPFWTVDTLFYALPKEDIELNFVFDLFQNIDWKKEDESTGVPSLSKTAINNIDIHVPKYVEQHVVGGFFYNLDNLITLHQRKLEKLKNIKKACLEKMFV